MKVREVSDEHATVIYLFQNCLPNPNVLIEYGYALKSVGYGRMIAVLNKAFGDPGSKPLPFDLQHKRWPFIYEARPSDPEQERRSERNRLSQELQPPGQEGPETEPFEDGSH